MIKHHASFPYSSLIIHNPFSPFIYMQLTYIPKPFHIHAFIYHTHIRSHTCHLHISMFLSTSLNAYKYPYIIVALCNLFNSHNYSTHICSINIYTQSFIHTIHLFIALLMHCIIIPFMHIPYLLSHHIISRIIPIPYASYYPHKLVHTFNISPCKSFIIYLINHIQ